MQADQCEPRFLHHACPRPSSSPPPLPMSARHPRTTPLYRTPAPHPSTTPLSHLPVRPPCPALPPPSGSLPKAQLFRVRRLRPRRTGVAENADDSFVRFRLPGADTSGCGPWVTTVATAGTAAAPTYLARGRLPSGGRESVVHAGGLHPTGNFGAVSSSPPRPRPPSHADHRWWSLRATRVPPPPPPSLAPQTPPPPWR